MQGMQAAAPASAHRPGSQATQTVPIVAPIALLAVAAGQGTQAKGELEPSAGLNVPFPQSVHTGEPGVEAHEPALQVAHVAAEVAASEPLLVPTGQREQLLALEALPKEPGGHGLHTP